MHSGAQRFTDWLTVAEAVAYCEDKGLARTPKTIRKWSHRSHLYPDNAELVVRREDVDNGFRWTIERASLDRKIEQELEFEARRAKEHDNEPVHTGTDASEQVHTGAASEQSHPDDANLSEQVQTGASSSEPVRTDDPGNVQQLEARIEDLRAEIEFLRDELRDRRHATVALTDVIETFRLTAASNASRFQERNDQRSHDIIRQSDEGDKRQGDEQRDTI